MVDRRAILILLVLEIAVTVGCSGARTPHKRKASFHLMSDPEVVFPVLRRGRRYWNAKLTLGERAGVGFRVHRSVLKFVDRSGAVIYSNEVKFAELEGRHIPGDSEVPLFVYNWTREQQISSICYLFYIEDDLRNHTRFRKCLDIRQQPEPYVQRARYIIPLHGRLKVTCGHSGCRTHYISYQKYSWDFIVLDARGRSQLGASEKLRSYYTFGAPVVAPADGVVISVTNDNPDNPPLQRAARGNEITIDHGNGEVSVLEHFQQRSITVRVGERVRQGQIIGRVGNSGNTALPHLHFSVKRKKGYRSLPVQLSHYYLQRGESWTYVARGTPSDDEIVVPAPLSTLGR